MRFSIMSLGLMAASALAAPMPSMVSPKRAGLTKRAASLEDVATTGYATMNGGTTGGKGGKTIEVSTLKDLEAAVKGDDAAIVLITGPIKGASESVRIGSNKSVIGKDSSVIITDVTLSVKDAKNVILRNFQVQKARDDAIAIQKSSNVWVDHVDLSSDRDHGKDHYDGLLDITHAVDFVTVSNSHLHDHYKCSLVGHSDSNGAEDKGHLTVTYNNNLWTNVNSRGPSVRFGTVHLYNNVFENVSDGMNTRQGAQLLVQNNVWSGAKKALYSTDGGFAVAEGNDFGGSKNTAPKGTFSKAPYEVSLLETSEVKAAVKGTAGATLSF